MCNKFFINFLKVSLYDVNQRLDNFLFKNIKNLPRCKIYSLIRKGNIRVNNKRKSYKYKLNINDILRLPLINFNNNKFLYLHKNIINKFINKIIYEDNYIILINKPSGISVHDGNKVKFNLIDIYRSLKLNKYLNLVHRLDKYSSGLLLISKNKNILVNLNNQFKNFNIIKKYYILVCGIWPKNVHKIDTFIYKYKNRGYITVNKNNKYLKNVKLKWSLTYFKIIKFINNFTLLKAYPITGRFHQIRLHVSFLGYPILYDNLYGNKYLNNKFYINKISRLFLHCNYISFFHCFLKKKLIFNIKLDNDLYFILKFIKNRNLFLNR